MLTPLNWWSSCQPSAERRVFLIASSRERQDSASSSTRRLLPALPWLRSERKTTKTWKCSQRTSDLLSTRTNSKEKFGEVVSWVSRTSTWWESDRSSEKLKKLRRLTCEICPSKLKHLSSILFLKNYLKHFSYIISLFSFSHFLWLLFQFSYYLNEIFSIY